MPYTKNYDLDTDTTLGGNNASDYVAASQKAIKDYVDNHSGGGTVDQTYDPTSVNAQSGVAIAGAGFGKVKTVNNTQPDANGNVTVTASITSTDVINALDYTPENQANKVTSITSSSTDTQYPSAKSVIALLKTIYPVGCVYLTTNSTCPLSSLFGTWALVSSNRALWTGTGSNGGTTKAASLPNITGTSHIYTTSSYAPTGGFYRISSQSVVTGNSTTNYALGLDASGSNSMYSSSATTVQPPAYVVNVFRRTA